MSQLEFIPFDGVYRDFLLTTADSANLQETMLAWGANRRVLGNYVAYVWDVPSSISVFGLGVIDGRLEVGPKRLSRRPMRRGAGSYVVLDLSRDQGAVQPDPFGMHPVYYSDTVITNRLHLGAMAVRDFDPGAALTSTYNEGVFSFSLNTFSTPVKGMRLLEAGCWLTIGSSIAVVDDEVHNDFTPAEPEQYHQYVDMAAQEIISNVDAILESGFPITCDITGGRDSRIVFGALVALGRVGDVEFNTNQTDANLHTDLVVASGLVKEFGGRYSGGYPVIGYSLIAPKIRLAKRRSQIFGSYHFITPGDLRPISSLIHGYAIRMLGGGGELYRDYFQTLFDSVDPTAEADESLVASMLQRHVGTVFGEKFMELYAPHFVETFLNLPGQTIGHKLDAHYLNFRNRFHFGSRISTPGALLAINPALSGYALRAARSLPSEEKATGRVLFDVIRAMDERLAYLPFDKPQSSAVLTSAYHRHSRFDREELRLESGLDLLGNGRKAVSPVRPERPATPPFDFPELLWHEIAESLDILRGSDAQLSEVLGRRLDSFLEYAREKSPRHLAASASRLRLFADLVDL